MNKEIELTYEKLRTLASETRRKILKKLAKRPYTSSELGRILGKHVTTISEHLSKLESEGLVKREERPGRKWVFYQLTPLGRKIVEPDKRIYFIITLALILSVTAIFFWTRTPELEVEGLIQKAKVEQFQNAVCIIDREEMRAHHLSKEWNLTSIEEIRLRCLSRGGVWRPANATYTSKLRKLVSESREIERECKRLGIC